MSRIKSTDDPGTRFAQLMAQLYFFMAKEMMEQLGEEKGQEAILHAVNEFGKARAEAMKGEAMARGLDINSLDTYRTVRDMPGQGWETNPHNSLDITYCPMQNAWEEYGDEGQKLGYLYCQIDHILYGEFGFDLKRPFCLAKGDHRCLFQLTEKKQKATSK
ncbi:MAG: L-2-amino-thiazoline-4-carboxylic acid hydrolase [Dehalobacterium sp.]